MKDKTAPVRIGKGSRKVAIYPPTTASAYYRISYHLGGKRIQRTRRTLEEARKEAQAILNKLDAGEVTVAQATPLDIAALQAAKLELHGLNVRLDRAVADYAQVKRLLGDIPLQDAVTYYLNHNPRHLRPITVPLLVDEFLVAKADIGVSPDYIRDLRYRLRNLARHFKGAIDELTCRDVSNYFRKLNYAAENHCNQMRVVRTFFNYARAQGYMPEAVNLLKSVAKKKIRRGNYALYQPGELLALLEAADKEMIAPLTVLAFCGVRPNEMRRLKWQDIRLATRTLVVDAMSAKTASRRTVPLCDAALYWLNSCEPSEGLLWLKKADHWNRRLNRLHKRAGVTQQSNGLRHSYISYRLTLTGDVNRTALEAGNSPSMIHAHYHALVEDPALASQWFEAGLEKRGDEIRMTAG